jgi:hypothetical protein
LYLSQFSMYFCARSFDRITSRFSAFFVSAAFVKLKLPVINLVLVDDHDLVMSDRKE